MKSRDAKIMFDRGLIKSFQAINNPMDSGWILVATTNNQEKIVLHTSNNDVQIFSSIDILLYEVKQIAGELEYVDFTFR